jgi:Pectinacetylesterase
MRLAASAVLCLLFSQLPLAAVANREDSENYTGDGCLNTGDGELERHILSAERADRTGARCLDGSGAGFFVRANRSETRWVVFLEGGGWCYTAEECLARSKTALGSSKFWPARASLGGILSQSRAVNDFCGWNAVQFSYCDGASFAGNRDVPLIVNGTALHMRGHSVLRTLFSELRRAFGFDAATRVVLAGNSAGGLGVVLHTDFVRHSLIPERARATFRAVVESGYFLDVDNALGKPVYGPEMHGVFELQHVGSALSNTNAKCLAHYGRNHQEWRCLFSPFVLPFVTTPIFLIQSGYDAFQQQWIVGKYAPAYQACAFAFPTNCSAHDITQVANPFRRTLLASLTPQIGSSNGTAVITPANRGAFVHSCWSHGWAQLSDHWTSITIGSVTIREAVREWFAGTSERSRVADDHLHVDCEMDGHRPFSCNPTCHQ